MRPGFVLLLVSILLIPLRTSRAEHQVVFPKQSTPDYYQQQIRRNYRNTSRYLLSDYAILLVGSPAHIMRLSTWLDEIIDIPFDRQTLEAIFESGNQLTIRHSTWALDASGRTLASMSRSLTNGRGMDVEILFDVRIPEQGSHRVFDA